MELSHYRSRRRGAIELCNHYDFVVYCQDPTAFRRDARKKGDNHGIFDYYRCVRNDAFKENVLSCRRA